MLTVFKWVRGSASETAPTWAISVSACYVTQDQPVYIPRAVQRLVRWVVIEHLIRRSGHVVQASPSLATCWIDVPCLSTCACRCLAYWQQSSQLSVIGLEALGPASRSCLLLAMPSPWSASSSVMSQLRGYQVRVGYRS